MSTTMLIQPGARFRSTPDNAAVCRVLVAISLYSDKEGLTCRQGDEALMESASVTPVELAGCLRALSETGWIRTLILPAGHPVAGRVIVLMDHEAAGWYLRETYKSIRAFKPAHQ